jgi:uroporphyrinogen decarboxylase
MTQDQWIDLLKLIDGEKTSKPPVGFIIDSPWLPGWSGCHTMDYYSSDETWFNSNMKAIKRFPDATFLPGFWSEYGEINEPSAFGTKLDWAGENLPHAWPLSSDIEVVCKVDKPDVRTDGLLPLMINRLRLMEPRIWTEGHEIKFAIARGPFNIASFLMGASEFMIAMMMHPEKTHQLLRTVTDFTVDWLSYQKECIPSMEGIFVLDDLIGFVGEPECTDFAVPYLIEIFSSFDARVNFFHNDSDGLVVAEHLQDIGVNIYNFSFKHSMTEMRNACGEGVVLLGNIPPRDVLSLGTEGEVKKAVKESFESIADPGRIMWSGGGGVPQGVPSENLDAFIEQVYECYESL